MPRAIERARSLANRPLTTVAEDAVFACAFLCPLHLLLQPRGRASLAASQCHEHIPISFYQRHLHTVRIAQCYVISFHYHRRMGRYWITC